MGRLIVIALLGILILRVVVIGGSYLVVFWRDTMRRWRLEKAEDRKRQIREAKEEFLESSRALNNVGKKE